MTIDGPNRDLLFTLQHLKEMQLTLQLHFKEVIRSCLIGSLHFSREESFLASRDVTSLGNCF